jgi:hypothetical protein
MSLTQTHIQEITDYRLIQTSPSYDVNIPKFVKTVNDYLKKGYILKGSLKTLGETLSQVVIKSVSPSSEPVVETYEVIGVRDNNIITLERTVMDALRNGWSLYGDHDYSKYSTDHSYIWQVLVKYKKSVGNPFDGF